MQSDLLVWIGPAALDLPAGLGGEGGRGVRGVFDAVFSDPGVALCQRTRSHRPGARSVPVCSPAPFRCAANGVCQWVLIHPSRALGRCRKPSVPSSPSMRLNPLSGSGTVLVERYRLQERLSGPDPLRGSVWRAVDVMAGDCPVALRQLNDLSSQEPFRQRWEVLQTIGSHHLPRFGQLLDLEDGLWAVRDWIEGSSLASLQQQRARRQMVFSAGEVLLLMRQVLPVLGALHSDDLVHGHISLQNLWRRTSDGLPVVLNGELVPAKDAASWMDVRDLAVSAVALLTGQPSNLPFKSRKAGAGSRLSSCARAVAYGGSEPPLSRCCKCPGGLAAAGDA